MKKILFVFILIGVLAASIALATPLENKYPVIGNSTAPSTARADLPTFLKYMFNFALIGAALVVFGALVFGGIKYIASSGNPGQTGAAKEMIFSAFLGLGVILFSWLFLNTINPQLTTIELPSLQSVGGVKVTFDDGSIVTYSSSVGSVGNDVKKVTNINFTPENYEVTSYASEYWKDAATQRSPGDTTDDIKSLKIVSKIPGVYLCYDESSQEICQNFTYSAPSFGDLKGKFTKIKLLDEADWNGNITKRYIAVVFEKENYGFGGLEIYENKGKPPTLIGPVIPGTGLKTYSTMALTLKPDWVSSIKVSYYNTLKTYPGNVTFWNGTEFGGDKHQDVGESITANNLEDGVKEQARSIDIQGQRLVALCENACDPNAVTVADIFKCSDNNRCQIFSAADADLTNDSIGTCRTEVIPSWSFNWLKKSPCAKYFIIRTYEKQ